MSASYLTSAQLRRKLPLVDRFMLREARVQGEAARNNPILASKSINPEPFQPSKNMETGRWIPPRLSLRRQAQLGKEAYKQGRFEELTQFIEQNGRLQSVKLGKMKARIEELAAEETITKSPLGGAGLTAEETLKESRSHKEEKQRALALAKALAATRGPYSGRSLRYLFKGTKAERQAPAKKLETLEKLSTMDKSIETWRKTRAEAKNKTRPSLPF